MIIVALVYGLLLGSFANVIIYRLPRGLEFVKAPSACTSCGKTIKAVHNIPVFGWLFLRGKCAHCAARISPRYLAVELLTGVMFTRMFWRHEDVLEAALWCVFMLYLIIAAFIDADTQLLPNSLNAAGLAVALAYVAFNWGGALDSLIGAAVGGGFLLAMDLMARLIFKKPGMGGGDIKLMAVCGIFLGGWGTVAALWLAAVIGGAYGVFLLAAKRAERGAYFAFGPFLCAGVAAAGLLEDVITGFFA
jgi:leader peptidase (prepilin peptidase)/N-methyltransferase